MISIRFRMIRSCILLLLAAAMLAAPSLSAKSRAVENEKTEESFRTVKLGIITLYHPLVMYRKYQPFADYLSANTPFAFELKISENYSQIIEGLRKGSVHAAILGGLTYLEANRKADILPLLAVLGENGRPVCQGTFITRDDNLEIRNLSDLKGKRFAFASTHSTSGNLMPLDYLYSQSIIRLDDFQSHIHLKYHDSVVREVLRGNYDAGVALGTIVGQYEAVGLKVIGQTDPFPGFVLVVRKDMPHAVREAIRNTLLTLDPADAQDRKLMQSWDVNIQYGFAPTSDRHYDRIRRAVEKLSDNGLRVR